MNEAHQAIQEIARKAGEDLAEQAIKLYDTLTPDELFRFSAGGGQSYRLAKTLIVAIANEGRIDWQWSAEAIKTEVKFARRIYRNRL